MALLLAGTVGDALNNIFSGFDWSLFSFFGSIQCSFLTVLANIFTAMGSTAYVVLFGVMGLIFCFFRRTRRLGLAIIFAAMIGTLITNFIVKPWALRIRPYNVLQSNPQFWAWYVGAGRLCESDYCFPSGHTTGATEVAIVLMLCHIKANKKKVAWIFPIFALLTGASRIYLMVHYASDVLGGLIIGVFAGFMGYLLSGAICNLLHKKRLDRVIDLGKKFRHKIAPGYAVITIAVGWMIIFVVACLLEIGGSHKVMQRCAYNKDYDCQNEAQVDNSKYPAIDGKYFCKIHWKELSKQFEETGTIDAGISKEDEIKEQFPIPNSDLFTFFNDPVWTAFKDNFETNMPAKMEYTKGNNGKIEITDPAVIKEVFNTLKEVKIADEDKSGTTGTDSSLTITFFMPDSTQNTITFNSPSQLLYKEKVYFVINNNNLFNLNIVPETVPETVPEPAPETEPEYEEEEEWEEWEEWEEEE